MAAETPRRSRRTDKYAETPERVQTAAQQMQTPVQPGAGAPTPEEIAAWQQEQQHII